MLLFLTLEPGSFKKKVEMNDVLVFCEELETKQSFSLFQLTLSEDEKAVLHELRANFHSLKDLLVLQWRQWKSENPYIPKKKYFDWLNEKTWYSFRSVYHSINTYRHFEESLVDLNYQIQSNNIPSGMICLIFCFLIVRNEVTSQKKKKKIFLTICSLCPPVFWKEEGQCDFDNEDGQQIYDDCFDNPANYLYISLSDVLTHILQYKMDVFLKKLNSDQQAQLIQIFFDELEKRITKKYEPLNEFGNGTFIIYMWLCNDMALYWYDVCKISNDEDNDDNEEKNTGLHYDNVHFIKFDEFINRVISPRFRSRGSQEFVENVAISNLCLCQHFVNTFLLASKLDVVECIQMSCCVN
ncbi:hypothetical protein RFI_35395 [Reticulomyxa filosa]|uniref:Uncharacterized protein n=1 Tax=Reticulomyxa filosa TaxID=46433 RepID=X6LKZ7_RETFI|nr:hypothetical protein RFI_35395 [Reticulomyxa filosa]|eukprot:ETO02041.1 hypothetical protein RFI_35395 [Reticulomyxa filosa]